MDSIANIDVLGGDVGPNAFENDGEISYLNMLEKYDLASDCVGIPSIDKHKLARIPWKEIFCQRGIVSLNW